MHPKNTCYSLAWKMLLMPQYPPLEHAHAWERVSQRRMEFKTAIQNYAKERGWALRLRDNRWQPDGTVLEEWELLRVVFKDGLRIGSRSEYVGPLEECCLKIVEDDIKRTEVNKE